MNRRRTFTVCLLCLAMLPMLGGCPTSGTTDDAAGKLPGDGSGNSAPTISGSPASAAQVGQSYSFRPSAFDPDGDALTFSIENRPAWAEFDTADGSLIGVPASGTEGIYANIRITVSDGKMSNSTPQFSVQVSQIGIGSATLSWNPPSQNSDGTPLMDLSAYRIYYGTSTGDYPNQIYIDNPGITTYVVDNLSPNTYFFVSTAINSSGMESNFSNVATKVVN